jgi:hypothetical protein
MALDTLLNRAIALLGFMDAEAAAGVLKAAGVSNEHAFLALKAAELFLISGPSFKS